MRASALAGWVASPARFTEDANAEEDLALGGYRDAVVVELLQNAADAAAGGEPARVLLRLRDGVLEVANTGAPLDAAGLQGLATLRASAKRGDAASVGRFGVGFAAVLAVTDAPVVSSGGAAVGFSADRTHALVAAEPALAAALAAREGAVPVLRLPFAVAAEPAPAGYTTVVRLPLRDHAAGRRLLADLDPTLLLVLPGIAELVVDDGDGVPRVVRVEVGEGELALDGRRWLLAERSVALSEDLLAGGRVEERHRRTARVRALVPADLEWPAGLPRVLRAPQPTDEPLTLPVLLSAPVPLEPGRRRTLPGPLRDRLLDEAALAVADLARRVEGPRVLRLVPTGLPAGEVDARVAATLLAALRADPPLPGERVLDLGRATAAAAPLLDGVLGGLLPAGWPTTGPPLAALGVERLDTAAVVDLLAGVERPPGWWRDLYDALADAPDRDALGALPVPLADGRRSPGPRGLLLAPPGVALGPLAGLRVVHPDAASPVLLTLGAVEAGPGVLLAELRPQVEDSLADADLDLADAVLPLVAAAGVRPGELPWLGELALPDSEGEVAPASELVLADGPLAAVLLPDGPLGVLDPAVQARHDRAALAACGVADGLVVVRGDAEVALLDDGEAWLDTLDARGGAEPAGVRDLELLAFPAALALLSGVPREALPYAVWWCDQNPVLGGLLPAEVLAPGGDPLLAGLYDGPPEGVPDDVLALLACRSGLPADDDGLLDLLDRLSDVERTVSRAQLRALHAHVAALDPAGAPPLGVRAVAPGGLLIVVPPVDAVVVDAPDLLPLLGSRPVVPCPLPLARGLADLLGVPLASSLARYDVVSADPLLVRDVDGVAVPTLWRLTPDGVLHAPTPAGRGRGEAWRQGRWGERLAFVERLRDPAAATLLDGEDDLAG